MAPPPSRVSPMDPFIKCSIFIVNSTHDYQNRYLIMFRFSRASHMTSNDSEFHAPVENNFLELCRYFIILTPMNINNIKRECCIILKRYQIENRDILPYR